MTIAVGFVCSDGLLFASDTLYSGDERVYGPKFWHFKTDTVSLICGGAGTVAGLKRTIDEIEHQLHPRMTRWDVLRAIEQSIKMIDDAMGLEGWDKTRLLVGTRENRKTQLHENDAGTHVMTRINHVSQCVGTGYSLGRYFARSLFRPHMSIKWAEIVAAHLIKNVKEYDSEHCGGDTELFALPDDGDTREIRDRAYISDLEVYLAQLEKAVSLGLPDEHTNDATLRVRISLATAAIDKALRSQVIEAVGTAVGGAVITGRAPTVLQSGSTLVSGFDPANPPLPLITLKQPPPESEEK